MKSTALTGTIAATLIASVLPAATRADEADARRILQSMSNYLGALDAFSFNFDTEQDVVTVDGEKLGLAHSGHIAVARPGQVHVTSKGGFTDLEMAFDGTILAVADADTALYTSVPFAGDLAGLIDALRDTYARPLPAADLLIPNAAATLMEGVTEVKDLGSGVIGGIECDHLAFRNPQADWQLWVAQGDTPYPCRFVITSRDVAQAPQYRVTVRDWRETADGAAFSFAPADGMMEVDMETFALKAPNFPTHLTLEASQ
ncbi:DUF2092 domain-containing protein [Meridianimarinicoccus sp. MJW13]|uniref:DUF2092 domain-containing protein n=1 Tax=Meridianimarinicoccus sp. MJW13 TaxID=2720031 RepID=UPI001868F3FF|nr:DUF2092 domain-containing protein [Fluviibacterium sp. MJW13]